MRSAIDRILDANLNRAREGLRVGEEIARLVLEDATLQTQFKSLRHRVTAAEQGLALARLIRSRDTEKDPGSGSQPRWEPRQANWLDLARANLRRAQEALRVLEEVAKLQSAAVSRRFKQLRFQSYRLEKTLSERLLLQNEKRPARRRT